MPRKPPPTGRCTYCKAAKADRVSCSQTHTKGAEGVERVRFEGADFCGDCSTPEGGFHHSDCGNERCPRCNRQFMGCPCRARQQAFRPGRPGGFVEDARRPDRG